MAANCANCQGPVSGDGIKVDHWDEKTTFTVCSEVCGAELKARHRRQLGRLLHEDDDELGLRGPPRGRLHG